MNAQLIGRPLSAPMDEVEPPKLPQALREELSENVRFVRDAIEQRPEAIAYAWVRWDDPNIAIDSAVEAHLAHWWHEGCENEGVPAYDAEAISAAWKRWAKEAA